MIPAQNDKHLLIAPPGAEVNNGSITCGLIDTQGFAYAKIIVITGAMTAGISTLKIQEADAESGGALTGPADIVGTRVGTDEDSQGNASALPTASDDDGLYAFYLDLRIRQRYLQPVITVADDSPGAYVAVLAELSLAQTLPSTPAERGNTDDFIV